MALLDDYIPPGHLLLLQLRHYIAFRDSIDQDNRDLHTGLELIICTVPGAKELIRKDSTATSLSRVNTRSCTCRQLWVYTNLL